MILLGSEWIKFDILFFICEIQYMCTGKYLSGCNTFLNIGISREYFEQI